MNTRRPVFLIVGLFVLLVVNGCATQERMYYWGDYSRSLYDLRKDGTEENLLKHKLVLEKIVEASNQRNLRVPPGVYAELGFIYFRQNKTEEAIRYFELEERTYPESRLLMDRLSQAARARATKIRGEETKPTKE